MANGLFVVYYRVSTGKQGKSGLGLQAQQDAVQAFLNGGKWRIVAEVREVESGTHNDRPELAKAMRLCRVHRATLLVAKQDRLSRNAAQILGMLDKGDVPFVCVDDPNTTRLNVGIKALIAEDEAEKASIRTKAALAVVRARGEKQLGGQRGDWYVSAVAKQGAEASLEARRAKASAWKADLMPILEDMNARGVTSLSAIAKEFNTRSVGTPRGKGVWTATQVGRLLASA